MAARTTDGAATFCALTLMNGECDAALALQQFLPCGQGIVLQHCIICIGVTADGHSTAYTERADTSAISRIALVNRIPGEHSAPLRMSQALTDPIESAGYT